MTQSTPKEIVVIGAGVIGLTTALLIQEQHDNKEYSVSIVADVFPSDEKTIRYTSHWAGAHHVSHAGYNPDLQKIDQETFNKMWELSTPGSSTEDCFMRLPQTEYYAHLQDESKSHPLSWMPDFKVLDHSVLPQSSNIRSGVSFTTFTIDTPKYLNYLTATFLKNGGRLVRGSVQHINQVVESGTSAFEIQPPYLHASSNDRPSTPPAAVVVCTGIGSRTLGGVEDKDVHPLRGQTVLLKAPWVKFGRTLSSEHDLSWTYIIPRRSGDVIIGGTRIADDWYPLPRKEITEDILARCVSLCPELAPPEIRAERTPTQDDLRPIIIEEGCGLRPARHRGVRLEVAWAERIGGGKVPVVFHYGHGGSGYQSSWGTASIAVKLLNEALQKA